MTRLARVAAALLVAVGCASSSLGPHEQAVMRRWLLCDECTDGELDSLAAIGGSVVEHLREVLLRGPGPERVENMRRQFVQHYERIVEAQGGDPVRVSEGEYVTRFLANYVARTQSRAAAALGAIATPAALAALRDAMASPGAYRADVMDAVAGALADTMVANAPATQAGTVAMAVPASPSVRVLARDGSPVAGVSVWFTAVAGSGMLRPTSVTTDASGIAAAGSWVLGPSPGLQSASARADGVAPVSFQATAANAAGDVITLLEGEGQTAPAGHHVPIPPAVLVTDGDGSPVAGAAVTFTVTAGGGTLDAAATLTTDGSGIAATRWRLGPDSGLNELTAGLSGTAGTAVTFSATATTVQWTDVAAGRGHTCGLVLRRALCWGDNLRGQLGHPTVAADTTLPVRVANRTLRVASVAPASHESGNHTCALAAAGDVFCWGANARGQLGDGTDTDRDAPTAVNPVLRVRSVVMGAEHTCADSLSGRIYCWGENTYGQLGDGTTTRRLRPVLVAGGAAFGGGLAAGSAHTCALGPDRRAYCWGFNAWGQIGDGTVATRRPPVAVSGGLRFRAVVAGGAHTCGLAVSDTIYCWGRNDLGQLGDGTTVNRQAPVSVGGPWAALSAGSAHTCALTVSGEARCWGANNRGQLGDGTHYGRTHPTPVAGGLTFRAISAGEGHTCAVAVNGAAYCWGRGSSGQLGDGDRVEATSPVRVGEPE